MAKSRSESPLSSTPLSTKRGQGNQERIRQGGQNSLARAEANCLSSLRAFYSCHCQERSDEAISKMGSLK
jgi:hypothetical protein